MQKIKCQWSSAYINGGERFRSAYHCTGKSYAESWEEEDSGLEKGIENQSHEND